jgi:hypothetical protein
MNWSTSYCSLIIAALVCVGPLTTTAQASKSDSTQTFGGMTLAYSRSDNDLPEGRRSYTLQPSVNGALGVMQVDFGLRYRSRKLHVNLAVQQGWFADANYTGQDFEYRHLQQAWLQYDLTADVSVRAGVMPSHIGYESINERDNLIVSRLFCSDATPYYETGGSVLWKVSDKITVEGLILNGWQRIVATNDEEALGSRVVWKPDSTITVNWSTFYGNTSERLQPSSMRLYNNVWTEWMPYKDLTLVGIADFGRQMITGDSSASMWCVAAIAAYRPHQQWRVALRAEYFSDPHSIIVRAVDGDSFVASSISANVDWLITMSTRLRAEIRRMASPESIFLYSSGLTPSEVFATISASTSF